MLAQTRHHLIKILSQAFSRTCPDWMRIEKNLMHHGVSRLFLDHFAVIDLPGPHTGIPALTEIFSLIGYRPRGQGYLPDKQNTFVWLTEPDYKNKLAQDALPQIVIADFRLSAFPEEIKTLIEKYAAKAKPPPLAIMRSFAEQAMHNQESAAIALSELIADYLNTRNWPLPTVKEFELLRSFNELLAWVCVFGRQPNHFALAVHLLDRFSDLQTFHHILAQDPRLIFNTENSLIKGGPDSGIAQTSTMGNKIRIDLADGEIETTTSFVEFVWRFPHRAVQQPPIFWEDHFTDFVGEQANDVIESLYITEK